MTVNTAREPLTRSFSASPGRQWRHPPRRSVDGVLLLDKPAGLSSNAALQHAKRLYNAAKAGHTGTLDPLASGLLPICFGEATKFAQLLLDADKVYRATLHLGVTTTTGDAEGERLLQRPVNATRADLEATLPRFVGAISQIPPRHAARKYQGRNYYEYAREGVEIPRPSREVIIRELCVEAWAPPAVELAIRCSKGTYIRVLAEDLGEALGCGAHLSALRRLATAGFDLVDAMTLDALAAFSESERDRRLLPADAACSALPRCELSRAEAAALREGRIIARAELPDATYRAYADSVFSGVVQAVDGIVRSRRLLAGSPPSPRVESLES
jgi:tRNA pseudouridine55 synthase